jgi:NAD(P)-dependent dehydrogenase (short-subunit alcohol dehydrogenase family)
LNLSAAFFTAQGAAPHLRRTRGKIVNLADLAAFEVWPSYLPLNVTKAGVVMLTQALARVLAPEVTVNAVAPGAVFPPDDWPAEARARLAATTPLRRLGSPDDVVRAVLFLLENDYVTGVVLPVDGGRLVRYRHTVSEYADVVTGGVLGRPRHAARQGQPAQRRASHGGDRRSGCPPPRPPRSAGRRIACL